MNGRIATLILTIIVPIALLALTIEEFSSNPVAVLVLFGVMIAGGLYLLTYQETFA